MGESGLEESGICIAILSHEVPHHEEWYNHFRATDKFHDDLGITYSQVSFFEQDERPFVRVIHVFPKEKTEDMRKAMTFTGPPFVGGSDLIKKKLVMQPISSQLISADGE